MTLGPPEPDQRIYLLTNDFLIWEAPYKDLEKHLNIVSKRPANNSKKVP